MGIRVPDRMGLLWEGWHQSKGLWEQNPRATGLASLKQHAPLAPHVAPHVPGVRGACLVQL